jgi:hypothetical protein
MKQDQSNPNPLPHSSKPSPRIGSGASITQTTPLQSRNKKLAKKAAQAPKKGLNDNGVGEPQILDSKRSNLDITYDIEELLDWLEIHMRGPHMNALEK